MSRTAPHPHQVRVPRQERSRETLSRILEATEALLSERLLEDITLTDILDRSRVSVGAFYARFTGKDAIVPCLYDRYDRRLTAGAGRILEPRRWEGRGLDSRVRLLLRYLVMLYRRNQGLMRALTLHARAHPGCVDDRQRRNRAALYDSVAAMLRGRREEMTHPNPGPAVRLGLLMVAATCREKILCGDAPHPDSVRVTDRELARELSRAFLAFVGAKGEQS